MSETATLTQKERELARHALGLPTKDRRSYRNRFVTALGHPDYPAWRGMVQRGLAQMTTERRNLFGGADLFWLTRAGAEAALEPGEGLDPEDFPEGAAR